MVWLRASLVIVKGAEEGGRGCEDVCDGWCWWALVDAVRGSKPQAERTLPHVQSDPKDD